MKNRLLALLIVGLCLLCSCSQYKIQERQYENLASEQTMIIAIMEGAGSPFKTELVDSLVAKYRGSYDIEVVDARLGVNFLNKPYDVLILIDKVRASLMLNNNLRSSLKLAKPDKTIVFLSAGDDKYKWENEQFTAVTGATKNKPVHKLFNRLCEKIDALGQPRP